MAVGQDDERNPIHPSSRRQLTPDERALAERVDEIIGPEICALLERIDKRRDLEAQRGLKALALAPTLHVYWALIRGERVPWTQLMFFTAQRYGLKRRHPDGRYGLDDFNDVPRPT